MAIKCEYRSVFISDLHLGSRGCRAEELAAFLKRIRCEKLYLVGDVIDMWRLRQRWYWPTEHNKIIRRLLRMAGKGTEVTFVPGNHDEHARQFIGLSFGDVRVARQVVHETADGRKLLVTHGDQFDLIVKNARMLSVLGARAYNALIVANLWYNRLRSWLGLPYYSLSRAIKLKVKRACTFISDFERTLMAEAHRRGYDGVICGHIHKAEVRHTERGAYYNCGDWVESCTALVEYDDGKIQLIDGAALVEQLRETEGALKAATAGGVDVDVEWRTAGPRGRRAAKAGD